MIKIKNKSECSGCHACFNICPKQCITMTYDSEGFLYPVVDMSACIDCGLCEKVCHVHAAIQNKAEPKAYACYSLNEEIRAESSSGGMFSLFADNILEKGGAVFGAAFDDNLNVKHICIDSKEQLYKLRGSKYVQSTIGDTYKKAKELLENGKTVLFTGTPCQIQGLRHYLGKDYDNLYTQDIICHGVPSVKLWDKYLKHIKSLHKSDISTQIQPFFRDKTSGWLNYSVKVRLKDGTAHCQSHKKDPFMQMFLSDKALRPSCYSCAYKGIYRDSDITLADFWGADKQVPDMFDDRGTSLLFVNTQKGAALFSEIMGLCKYKEVSANDAVKRNPAAHTSATCVFARRKIMKNIDAWDFETLRRICTQKSFFEKLERRVKSKASSAKKHK